MIFDSFYEILNSVNFRGRTSKTTDWEDTRGSDKGKPFNQKRLILNIYYFVAVAVSWTFQGSTKI